MGPWLTPASEIADPQNLKINSWVNGAVEQDTNSRDMIYSVAEQIVSVSARMTGERGLDWGLACALGRRWHPHRTDRKGQAGSRRLTDVIARSAWDFAYGVYAVNARISAINGHPYYDTDPFTDAALKRPFEHYRAISDLGPVVRLKSAQAFALSRFTDVQAALRAATHGANHTVNYGETDPIAKVLRLLLQDYRTSEFTR